MQICISKECRLADDEIGAFATLDYLKNKGQDYGYIYGILNNKIIMYTAFILKKKYLFCLVEFQTAVICLYEQYKCLDSQFLEDAVLSLGKKYDVDFICQNPAYAIFDTVPRGADYTYFGSYVCDLQNSEEVLWKNVHSKHRNVIRKAIKSGVEIKFNATDIHQVYKMLKDTQDRSGNNFISEECFYTLRNSLPHRIDIVAAYHEDILQGCAILVYDNDNVYYLYGGSCPKTSIGAMNLLHWRAMIYYKNMGLKHYDFVGARLSDNISVKLHGIQRFKGRFGGELHKGFLWKYIFKRHKYILYKLLSFVRYHRWKVDAIDEEHITDI